MPLIIKNIQQISATESLYSVQINDQTALATFVHNRSQGVSACLRDAAKAVDGNKVSPDFMNGVRWAINQLNNEAFDLSAIRDSYIEAKKTGLHNGRRIKPEFATACVSEFKARSDSLYVASENLEKALKSF